MDNIKSLSYDKNLDTFLSTVEPSVILCKLRNTLQTKNFDTTNWHENSLASGYYSMENMDLIDPFIGSKGTLGIITEIQLKLLKKPKSIYGVTVFLDSEEKSINFVESLRENLNPAAIEFFNNNALNLIRKRKKSRFRETSGFT